MFRSFQCLPLPRGEGRGVTLIMQRLILALSIGAVCTALVQAQDRADLSLSNGVVFPADGSAAVYSTIVIRDGRVLALGGAELLERYRADRVIDLRGRLVVPGFNDTSMSIGGVSPRSVDLTGSRSIAEIGFRIRRKAEALGPGEWVTASGWSEAALAEGRRPGKQDLDNATSDNPVLISLDGNGVLANGTALRLAQITGDTEWPEGGEIELDVGRQPTGVLRGTARNLVEHLVPDANATEERRSLIEQLRGLPAKGITSLIQTSQTAWGIEQWEGIYARYGENFPRAAVRFRVASNAKTAANAIRALGKVTGDGDERMRVGALRVVVDGGFGGPAAWTLESYRDQPDFYGRPAIAEAELFELVKDAHELGWQIGFVTVGDAAIQMTVDVLARVLDESPRHDHRHYLSGFTVLPPPETMMTMASRDILIALQPNLTYSAEQHYQTHLFGARLSTNNALRTPMNYGLLMALGSDARPIDPLLGLYGATTRRGRSGEVYAPNERLTMAEAIAGYTRNGAYLTFEERVKGTLVPGMLADLVVLSENLLTIDPLRTMEVVVDLTVIGGRVVYER